MLFRRNQHLYLNSIKHEDETGTTGDGRKTLQEFVSNYNKVTDEVIMAKMD